MDWLLSIEFQQLVRRVLVRNKKRSQCGIDFIWSGTPPETQDFLRPCYWYFSSCVPSSPKSESLSVLAIV